jgi:hypothetical protein
LATLGSAAGAGDARFEVRSRAWLDPGQHVPSGSGEAGHELLVGVVILDGAGWGRDEVLAGVFGMAALLAQCGIRLAGIDLAEVGVPPAYLDLDTPRSRELAAAVDAQRPALFFIRDTRHQPAFDAEAIGRGNSRSRPEMADSVWVTRAAPDLPVVLAHELAHVLANSGAHVDLPGNLMRDESDPAHTHLSGWQCTAILEQGAQHGLIRPLHTE